MNNVPADENPYRAPQAPIEAMAAAVEYEGFENLSAKEARKLVGALGYLEGMRLSHLLAIVLFATLAVYGAYLLITEPTRRLVLAVTLIVIPTGLTVACWRIFQGLRRREVEVLRLRRMLSYGEMLALVLIGVTASVMRDRGVFFGYMLVVAFVLWLPRELAKPQYARVLTPQGRAVVNDLSRQYRMRIVFYYNKFSGMTCCTMEALFVAILANSAMQVDSYVSRVVAILQ